MKNSVLFVFIILTFFSINSNSAFAKKIKPFPLEKGNEWVYEGVHKFTGDKGVQSRTVKFSMKVKEVVKKGAYKLALVENFPSALCWNDELSGNRNSLLVVKNNKQVYLIFDSAAVANYPKTPVKKLVENGELILDFPLTEGKQFGFMENVKRIDKFFCWVVDSVKRENPADIQGIEKDRQYLKAALSYNTAPDTRLCSFIEGIGICSYEYVHHGTIEELRLKLTAVKLK